MTSCMQVTLTEEIGAAGQEVSSKAEARRLAFYLFWNIKPYFDRCAYVSVSTHCRGSIHFGWSSVPAPKLEGWQLAQKPQVC
jgi:hypothetical protein